MPKLILISGKEFCKILEKIGFEKIYGRGSHVRFRHLDGRRTVIPVHGNEKLLHMPVYPLMRAKRVIKRNIKADKI